METVLEESDIRVDATKTIIDLPRFGECSFAESEVILFPWGLPGFERLRRFLVISMSETAGYVWLQSLDDLGVALPLCDPWSLFPDYDAPMPLYARQSLGIETAESFCVMCVLVASKGGGATSINLLAPIIINLEKRMGRQVALENGRYTVRTPVPRESSADKEVAPS